MEQSWRSPSQLSAAWSQWLILRPKKLLELMLLSEWVEFISVQMTLLHCYKVTCVIMVSNLNISKFNQASVGYRGAFFLITVVFPLCQDLQQPAILRQLSGVRSRSQSNRIDQCNRGQRKVWSVEPGLELGSSMATIGPEELSARSLLSSHQVPPQ